jgi:hypothetical protein
MRITTAQSGGTRLIAEASETATNVGETATGTIQRAESLTSRGARNPRIELLNKDSIPRYNQPTHLADSTTGGYSRATRLEKKIVRPQRRHTCTNLVSKSLWKGCLVDGCALGGLNNVDIARKVLWVAIHPHPGLQPFFSQRRRIFATLTFVSLSSLSLDSWSSHSLFLQNSTACQPTTSASNTQHRTSPLNAASKLRHQHVKPTNSH